MLKYPVKNKLKIHIFKTNIYNHNFTGYFASLITYPISKSKYSIVRWYPCDFLFFRILKIKNLKNLKNLKS